MEPLCVTSFIAMAALLTALRAENLSFRKFKKLELFALLRITKVQSV